jgi:hypothetical protein
MYTPNLVLTLKRSKGLNTNNLGLVKNLSGVKQLPTSSRELVKRVTSIRGSRSLNNRANSTLVKINKAVSILATRIVLYTLALVVFVVQGTQVLTEPGLCAGFHMWSRMGHCVVIKKSDIFVMLRFLHHGQAPERHNVQQK